MLDLVFTFLLSHQKCVKHAAGGLHDAVYYGIYIYNKYP